MKQNFYIALIALVFAGCGNPSKNAKNNGVDSNSLSVKDFSVKTQDNNIISKDTLVAPKVEKIDHLGYDKVLLFEKDSERELLYINVAKKSLDFKISYKNDTSKFELLGNAKLLNIGEESISDENNNNIDVAEYVYYDQGCELVFRIEEVGATVASVFPRACKTNQFDMLKYKWVLKIVKK